MFRIYQAFVMGYFGDWGSLQRNMDRVRDNIAYKKKIARQFAPKDISPSAASKTRKSLSLVDHHRKDLAKARVLYLILFLAIATILYFVL